MQPITVNPNILEMEYAVRGPIPQRAAEMKRQGRAIIPCNIGNPQALGQSPLTYFRQVLSLVENPALIERERALRDVFEETPGSPLTENDLLHEYILEVSERILRLSGTGTGAYTESKGFAFVRQAIADFINRRDGFQGDLRADPEHIFLTDGASDAAKRVLNLLIASPNDGVMIPIPQYPLYSASIKMFGGVQVNYYPDEENDWALEREELERAYHQAARQGVNVRAIVVINPGNPTGAVLDERSIAEVIDFAAAHDLAIIADEVYQDNTYGEEFVSFARVLGDRPLLLFSLHSISKGFFGECGHRGGYLEVRNPPQVSGSDANLLDVLLKQASVGLCSNTAGQILTYLMVSQPEEDNPVGRLFRQEKERILGELYAKASMIRAAFDEMEGVQCFGKTGAMYLFPRLNKLPAGTGDYEYCMALLEETGLVTVNGSGFGQKPGTHHLRIAFLPPKELLAEVLPRWVEFHNRYVNS